MSLFAGTFVTINTWGMFRQLIYTVLFPVLGGVALRELIERQVNVKNYLPVMPAISAMSFKGLEMLPVAVGFAFQMLTAVGFYHLN